MLATLAVGRNVSANLERALTLAAGSTDLIISPGVGGRAVLELEGALAALEGVAGIARYTPVLSYPAEPLSDIGQRRDAAVPGVAGFQLVGKPLAQLRAELVAGALPEQPDTVVLSEGFARQRGLAVGDTIRFVTPFGELPLVVSGLAADGSGEFGGTQRLGLMSLEALQAAVRLGGRVSRLELELADRRELAAVRERLVAQLGDRYTVTLPAGSGDLAAGIVQSLESGLQVLAATLVALAGFMAYNTFAAAASERTRELALLRTIALTRRQIVRLALAEALLLSAAGSLLGLGLGIGLSYLITLANGLLLGFAVQTLVVPLGTTLLAAAVGLAAALLAAYLPARAAARTPPIIAARYREPPLAPARAPAGALLVGCGVACALAPWQGLWAIAGSALSLALLVVGVSLLSPWLLQPTIRLLRPPLAALWGVSARLGSDFTLRNAGRNGVAIGAVVVGLTLTVGVGGMVAGINRAVDDWVETTIVGDLFVTTPAAFPDDFAAALSELPGVERSSAVAVRIARFEPQGDLPARSLALVLVEPERFHPEYGFGSFVYLDGDPQTGYQTLAEGGLLAANTVSERFALRRGSRARLRTREGFADFEVGGVIVDFTGGGEAFIGSLALLERFGGGAPDLYILNVRPGADPEAVGAALQAAYPELHLEVQSNAQYRERILSITRQTFITTNGLLALAILIAALGVANTLGMNLSARAHELALLRALGLARRDLKRLVTSEGVIVTWIGTLIGVASGLLLSLVITDGANALTGFHITPQFPLRLVALALASSPAVGLAAALAPARRAARLPPAIALGEG